MSTSAQPAASLSYASYVAEHTHVSERTASVPWYVWCGVIAITSASIGGVWDVSWHRTIGRDTFWTPAHMAIYACGVLAAVVCGYLIFATTFGKSSKLKAVSVNVFGFRAPLGAFIAAWGGIAMLTSAPFDNWWHAAYGLDVKIVSPPHTLLILGIRAVAIGVLFLILAAMNRVQSQAEAAGTTAPSSYKVLQLLFLYSGGLIVGGQMFFLLEYTWDVMLHSTSTYIAMAIALPIVFAILSQASRYRWAATTAAAVYTFFTIAEILILPLFPAQPKLGPVFVPVTHMVPQKFPVLILIPALALDLLWQRTRTWKPWKVAALSGFVFIAVLFAVEWPFAKFLLSKASENRFFGTIYFDYNSRPTGFDRLREFFKPDSGLTLYFGLLRASIYGFIGTWIGLTFGRWMRSVQR
jgi:hypothetical protein